MTKAQLIAALAGIPDAGEVFITIDTQWGLSISDVPTFGVDDYIEGDVDLPFAYIVANCSERHPTGK